MNKNRTCINFIEDMAGYSHKTFLAAIYSYSKQGTSRFSLQGGREFSNQGGILNIFKWAMLAVKYPDSMTNLLVKNVLLYNSG